ncbi:hypothetical protein TRVL_10280 [Trypanosoma vivax]|nr:hypothetical protein TRVL_10280 [Trypanosoma vivax]
MMQVAIVLLIYLVGVRSVWEITARRTMHAQFPHLAGRGALACVGSACHVVPHCGCPFVFQLASLHLPKSGETGDLLMLRMPTGCRSPIPLCCFHTVTDEL